MPNPTQKACKGKAKAIKTMYNLIIHPTPPHDVKILFAQYINKN
jgi:hypothetical protein